MDDQHDFFVFATQATRDAEAHRAAGWRLRNWLRLRLRLIIWAGARAAEPEREQASDADLICSRGDACTTDPRREQASNTD